MGMNPIVPAKYTDDPRVERAWLKGYDSARRGKSDFERRGFRHDTGERAAYMNGRVAGAADAMLARST